MIYFVHGDDRDAVLKKAKEIVAGALAKRGLAEHFRIEDADWNQDTFESLVGGAGLFESKYIVECSGLFGHTDARNYLLPKMEDLKNAEHLFLFVEGTCDKKTVEGVTPFVAKVYQFLAPSFAKKPEVNSFDITNAFAEKNNERAWVLLTEALRKGQSAEALAGTLYWQMKNLMIVKRGISQKESGLKEFPYKKALDASRRFTLDELIEKSQHLISAYHGAHMGECDLSLELEKIILG